MPHRIEIFTGNCPLCKSVVDEIEAGKCAGCQMVTYDMSQNPPAARQYAARVVPTVVIDGEVKIEGKPDIPFVCSDETYAHFKNRYPLTISLEV
ncbi:MAG TPA: thioredoxin family protein [Candidatus Bathyarchaeia archaeon]|nr:thioredoxin family protein [Candidatus Bathyarchaeia archaeon]